DEIENLVLSQKSPLDSGVALENLQQSPVAGETLPRGQEAAPGNGEIAVLAQCLHQGHGAVIEGDRLFSRQSGAIEYSRHQFWRVFRQHADGVTRINAEFNVGQSEFQVMDRLLPLGAAEVVIGENLHFQRLVLAVFHFVVSGRYEKRLVGIAAGLGKVAQQLNHPFASGMLEVHVTVPAGNKAFAPQRLQALIDALAGNAELLVTAVSQSQDGKAQAVQ